MESKIRRQFDHEDKLAILHHEIPTLVTPIKGFCTTIQDHPAYASERFDKIKEHLTHINRISNKITNLTFLHSLILPMREVMALIPEERILTSGYNEGTLHSVGQQLHELQAKRFRELNGEHYDPRVHGFERSVSPDDLETMRRSLETHAMELRRRLTAVRNTLNHIPPHFFASTKEREEFEKTTGLVVHNAHGMHTVLQAIGKPQKERFGLLKLLKEMDFDHVHAATGGDVFLHGKRPQLFLALFNLIKNARQHPKSENGRKIDVNVTAKMERTDGRVRLTINDTGKGMTAEELSQLFDLGFSGRGSSGIGTNITKHIVENEFGGTIGVQSMPGQGSIFTIEMDEHDKTKTRPSKSKAKPKESK